MKRWLIALLVVAVAISGLTLVAYAQQGKSKMIIVGAAGASPKTATIAKGTTVVWLNSSNDNVKIGRAHV